MAVKIQHRGDTAAAWTAANPTLAERELAFETDTARMKLGDGATAWNSLAYIETERQLDRVAVTVSGGVLALDMANQHERKFEVAAAQSSNFSVSFSNVTNAKFISLTVPITGGIGITFPSNVVSMRADSRWNNTTHVLTISAVGTGDLYEFSFNVLPGPKYILKTGDGNYAS